MELISGFHGSEHADEVVLRLTIAAVLGALLAVRYGRISHSAQAFSGISLAGATYVSIFLLMGVPPERLAGELVDTGLCLAPLCGFAWARLRIEQRANDLDLLTGLFAAVIVGLASGFGAFTWALFVTAATLLVYVLRNKKR